MTQSREHGKPIRSPRGPDGRISAPGVGAIIRDIWPDDQGRMWFVQWGRDKVTSAEFVERSSN